MPIFFIFFYDHRSASGSISGPEIAHPAICTGASGDLYWSIIGIISESNLIDDENFIFYWTLPLNKNIGPRKSN